MTMSEYIRKPSQNYFEKFRDRCLEKTRQRKEKIKERAEASATQRKEPPIGQNLAGEDPGRGNVLKVVG